MKKYRFKKAVELRITTAGIYYFIMGFTLCHNKQFSLFFFGKQLVSRKIGSTMEKRNTTISRSLKTQKRPGLIKITFNETRPLQENM